jgi:hypothetical protein
VTCPPGTVSLGEFYKTPPDSAAAVGVLARVFEKGIKLRGASFSLNQPVRDHLEKSYADTLKLRFPDFQGGDVNPNWALLVDHTFILGQLTVSLGDREPRPQGLRPRDVLRAQAAFSQATSSSTCHCFIPSKYELPAARPGEPAPKPKGPCGESSSGEIDSACPLC